MKEENITVLMVKPGEHPEITVLKNNLKSLQQAVSIDADYIGLIEVISITDTACIICNEEGKMIGLTPNRCVGCDILCGVFYIAGQDKEGNFTSLSEQEIERYQQRFWLPDIFLKGTDEPLVWGGFEVE